MEIESLIGTTDLYMPLHSMFGLGQGSLGHMACVVSLKDLLGKECLEL